MANDRLHKIISSLRCGAPHCPCARSGRDGWLVHCPVHPDGPPALHLRLKDGRLLVRCGRGCAGGQVLQALRDRAPGVGSGPVPPADQVWAAALAELRGELSPFGFKTYLQDTQAVGWEGRRLVVAVPQGFQADWLRSRLSSTLTSSPH